MKKEVQEDFSFHLLFAPPRPVAAQCNTRRHRYAEAERRDIPTPPPPVWAKATCCVFISLLCMAGIVAVYSTIVTASAAPSFPAPPAPPLPPFPPAPPSVPPSPPSSPLECLSTVTRISVNALGVPSFFADDDNEVVLPLGLRSSTNNLRYNISKTKDSLILAVRGRQNQTCELNSVNYENFTSFFFEESCASSSADDSFTVLTGARVDDSSPIFASKDAFVYSQNC